MGIVMWDKPKQVMSKEEWKGISADSAPPGVYTSNMSDEDRRRWKGKIVGATLGHPQVELRKVFDFCSNVLIIVSRKGGFQYKNITREKSADYNIYVAMNSGAAMTFEEMKETQSAVDEAIQKLIDIELVEDKKKIGKTDLQRMNDRFLARMK